MRENFRKRDKKKNFYLPKSDPFFKAIVTRYKEAGMTVKVEYVEMTSRNNLVAGVREPPEAPVIRVLCPIDELHDLAHSYVPVPDPNQPLTMEQIMVHFDPKAPKESGPMAPTKRVFVKVDDAEGYHLQELQVPIAVPTPAPVPAKKKRKVAVKTGRRMIFRDDG